MARKESAVARRGYNVLFFFIRLCSYLPLEVLYILSDCLYPIVHYIVRYRVSVVRKNLRNSFPEKTEAELRGIENKFYHYFCDLAVEIVKGVTMSEAEFKRRIRITGLEEVEKTFAAHDFCCCYLGHFGNWEWLTAIPLYLDNSNLAQIYHPMRNKSFNRWFLGNRSRFGAVNIPMKHTLRRMMALRTEMESGESGYNGYLLGCIADQLPKRENVHHRITFLNQSTGVFTGSERIGVLLNAAFAYSRISRPRRGYYQVHFEIMTTEPKTMPEFALTDDFMARFEKDVRQQPELWLWSHDRWKR